MEAHVRLFKKDDPTFEFNTLDRVKRWRAYVASYMAVEPTEDIDVSRIHYPYLKRRLAKTEDILEEDRIDSVKHSDKITVCISVAAYIMTFINSEPFGTGGVQYFLQPDAVRAGMSETVSRPVEEYSKLNDERKERAQEVLLRNNSWMKDMSQDDVDTKKAAFKKDIEEPRKIADDDDMDMEGADSY
jgi:paired amphipathic helix protein Sin3a